MEEPLCLKEAIDLMISEGGIGSAEALHPGAEVPVDYWLQQ